MDNELIHTINTTFTKARLIMFNDTKPTPYYYIFMTEYDTLCSLYTYIHTCYSYEDHAYINTHKIIHDDNITCVRQIIKSLKTELHVLSAQDRENYSNLSTIFEHTTKLFHLLIRESGFNILFQYGIHAGLAKYTDNIKYEYIMTQHDFAEFIEDNEIPIIDFIQLSPYTFIALSFDTQFIHKNSSGEIQCSLHDIYSNSQKTLTTSDNGLHNKNLSISTELYDLSTSLSVSNIISPRISVYKKEYGKHTYLVYYNTLTQNNKVICKYTNSVV